MKKILFTLLTVTVLLASCGKDNYVPGQGVDPGKDKEPVMADRVEGRVAIAYVTYYGTQTPDPTYLTQINYAFAEPYMENGEYKGFGLQGNENRFQQIVNLKKINSKLKIFISFTNSKEDPRSGCFSQLAKSADYRKAFANDCKKFLQKWGIDGVDMDWEFPGLSWSGDDNAYDIMVDVDNHIELMKELHSALGGYGLTYAGYCFDKTEVQPSGDIAPSVIGYRYIDIAAVAPYVDYVNIMTYDLDAADEGGNHQSALYDPKAYSDCTRAVQAYLDAGMSPDKLVLGIPFYARHSFGASTPTAINYNKVLLLDSSYKIDNWDNAASVPYITYNGTYYAGYDNVRSIGIKGEWLLMKGMKGMMFWDYDGDDSNGTLRKAVWNAVMKKS
ncbi:MAG: glycosyl hydrolase family 18 protein [Bacteroides sp.]|jgi:chitinase|nr:glycosyl hydrolase family 18 protein [Bacteroides sp.]MCI1682713.1 glycosyl hydrolase family 18 protein [Bacteroides sp.]